MFDKEIEEAKKPGQMACPTCGDNRLFAPMDKLSILLYGECSSCIEGVKIDNLLKLSRFL